MGVRAEAAAAAAQTLCRVLTVHAVPVRLLPVRVPAGLGVVVEAPREAGVVPPGVIILIGPVVGGASLSKATLQPLQA